MLLLTWAIQSEKHAHDGKDLSPLLKLFTLFLLSSALLKIRRSVHTENPAFRWVVEQTFVSCEAPVHLVQPCTQPVHQRDHARWAEAHWSPATFCWGPHSSGVSHPCSVGLCCHGVAGDKFLSLKMYLQTASQTPNQQWSKNLHNCLMFEKQP